MAERDHVTVERRAHGIQEAASQAYDVMEGLFAWASPQMGTVAVTLCRVDLCAVVDGVLAGAAEAAAGKGIALTSDCIGAYVEAHPDMLPAVLRNLVGNAVKFTRPGGAVTVTALRSGRQVSVLVSATGVGMPADKVADLFRLDRRVTTNGTAGERGSGLGLLLCRDLVERQGGTLAVESVPGLGTTFSLGLPAAAVPEQDMAS